MKCSVIGIGTELTTGQIINRNGSWISGKLKELGVVTTSHIVVPDDRHLIRKAFEFASTSANILFITGGLGPTSDDFTRELISEWCGQPLEHNEEVWSEIQAKLNKRNIPIRDIQKQQALIPRSANVLTNNSGTAPGFKITRGQLTLYALPGPPKEIEAIWNDHILSDMTEASKHIDRYITKSWDCLGVGESEIAHRTEAVLKDFQLEIGYRVHVPLVEVKISFFESQKSEVLPALEKLDQALSEFVVAKDGEDLAHTVSEKLKTHKKIQICDEAGGVYLWNRLFPHTKSLWANNQITFTNKPTPVDDNSLCLWLKPIVGEDLKVTIGMSLGGKVFEKDFESPFKAPLMNERRGQYFAEVAFISWSQWL